MTGVTTPLPETARESIRACQSRLAIAEQLPFNPVAFEEPYLQDMNEEQRAAAAHAGEAMRSYKGLVTERNEQKSRLTQKVLGGLVGALVAGSAGIEAVPSTDPMIVDALMGGLDAVVTVILGSSLWEYKPYLKARDKAAQTAQRLLGEPFALYPLKGKNHVILRWGYQPNPEEKVTRQEKSAALKRLALCANRNGVTRMAVDDDVYRDCLMTYPGVTVPEAKPWSAVMDDEVHSGASDDETLVRVMHPWEWQDILKVDYENDAEQHGTKIESLVAWLAKHDSTSQLVQTYNKYSADPKLQADKAAVSARGLVHRALEKIDYHRNELCVAAMNEVAAPVTPKEPQLQEGSDNSVAPETPKSVGFRRFESEDITGILSQDGMHVIWRTRNGPRSEDSFRALGLADKAAAEKLLLHPEERMQLAKRACALLLYQSIRSQQKTKTPELDLTSPKHSDPNAADAQADKPRFADPVYSHQTVEAQPMGFGYYRRRQIAAACLGAAVVVGGYQIVSAIGISNPTNASASAVGNVPDGPNVAAFNLTTHGNISAEGYWPIAQSDELASGNWLPEKPTPVPGSVMLPLTPPAGTTKWIKVDVLSNDALNYQGQDVKNLTNIDVEPPVLQGTEIIAANVGGVAVKLDPTLEGTYDLRIPAQLLAMRPKITYWVAPSPTAEVPRVDKTTTISGNPAYNQADFDKQVQTLTGEVDINTRDGAIRLAQYLNSHEHYSLQPLPADQGITSYSKWTDAATDILNRKKVNCNVVSSIITLADPQDIGAVWGYSNENNKTVNVLSAHDQHQWNDDVSGRIIDGTPGDASAHDQAYFDESIDSNGPNVLQKIGNKLGAKETEGILGGIAAIGLLGVAYSSRRKISKHVQAAARRTSTTLQQKVVRPVRAVPARKALSLLERTSQPEMAAAVALLERAAYGPEGATSFNRGDFRPSPSQAARTHAIAVETLLDRRNLDIRSDELVQTIRAKSETLPQSQRRKVDRTLRIVRLARWATR